MIVWNGHVDIDALLRDADLAMYAAKRAGKGVVACYDPDGTLRVYPVEHPDGRGPSPGSDSDRQVHRADTISIDLARGYRGAG